MTDSGCTCLVCHTAVSKDEIALTKKLINRGTTKYYCGSSGESEEDGKTTVTIFNSKTEIQEYLEEAAATYAEANDINIEVYYSNDTVAAHLSSKYAASDPYTIAMTDAKYLQHGR